MRRPAALLVPVLILFLVLVPRADAEAVARQQGDQVVLTNGELALTLDLATGTLDAASGGRAFATGMTAQIASAAAQTGTAGQGIRRTFTSRRIEDAYGAGVEGRLALAGPLPATLVLTVYDAGPFFLAQWRVPNGGGLRIRGMTIPAGTLQLGDDANDVACLMNYWSGSWYTEIHPVDVHEHADGWGSYSHFFAVLHDRRMRDRNVIVGAVRSEADARVDLRTDRALAAQGKIALTVSAEYRDNPLTVEGAQYASQPFFIGGFANVFDGMETYGAVVKAHRPMPVWAPPPAGWCSWDAGVSSDPAGILANVRAAAENRLPEYGFEYMQIDDGWQIGSRCSGNWHPKPNFVEAGGMKFLADEIRRHGMKPGLWIGPFGEDGRQTDKPFFVGPRGGAYDLSSPLFRQWLEGEMHRFCDEWGYDYIKADFLSYGGSASDTGPSNIAYREAVRLMKDVLGPDRYLMTCINREWLSVGVADGQRLGNDVSGGRLTGAYVSVINWGRRYFTNNTFWVGDPDMLHVNLPTLEQSRVWASFVALTGGAVMSGDNLPRLAPERIDLLKRTLPSAAITARPVDLFERSPGYGPKFARIWDARVERPWGTWHVLGLFNWTVDEDRSRERYHGEPQNLAVDFAGDLGLKADGRYVVYDYWADRCLGVFRDGLRAGLDPASCRVLAIHEDLGRPLVLGTDRHIVTGAIDLKSVRWDESRSELAARTETVPNTPYRAAIYVPPGFAVRSAVVAGRLAEVERGEDPRLVHVAFDAGDTGQVEWSVTFDRAAAESAPLADGDVDIRTIAPAAAEGDEIPLRRIAPLWTDRRHDIEGGPIAGAGEDLGTIAPFWLHYDVRPYSGTYGTLRATAANRSGREGGRVWFEVLGDGRRLHATQVLRPGQSEEIEVPISGVNELTLVCHYVDGWFSSTRGSFERPRLAW